jgi:hypothetical protein
MSTPYVRPVPNYGDNWLSSFSAHTRRWPKSSEPGVDYYCPIGTTLVSIGDGVVSIVSGSVSEATGRYVKVNLDDGRSFRYLHLTHSLKSVWQRVRKGEPLAISGASGYGSEYFGASSLARIPSNTGGPHVHATLWPTRDMRFGYQSNGQPYSLDLELYVDKSALAGGSSSPFPTIPKDSDMAYPIVLNGAHRLMLAPGFLKHFGDGPASDLTRNIVSAADEWIPLTSAQFLLQLDSFGIPRDRVDVATGWVYDVSLGRKVYGGMWSWARDAAHAAAQPVVPPPALDVNALAAAIVEKLPVAEIEPADEPPVLVTPTAADFPSWIRYDEKFDLQYLETTPEAWDERWQKYYGKPYFPVESHVHWWNEPGKGGTHDGNVDYLNKTEYAGANYVTSAGRVTLTMPLDGIALTTGQRNPYAWKSENDPLITTSTDDLGYLTLGYLHYIVEKKNPRLRGEEIRRHLEFYETKCSTIDVARVRTIADAFASGALDPATGKAP